MTSKFTVEVRGINEGIRGNCTIITINLSNGKTRKILLDCGIIKSSKLNSPENSDFDFEPKEIDGVFLTLDNLNHSGKILRLIQSGYTKKIYANHITKKFLKNSLDELKEKDKDIKIKVRTALKRIGHYDFGNRYVCLEDDEILLEFQFEKSGYRFGASMIYLKCTDLSNEKKETINLLYTGSYGKNNLFMDCNDISKDILNSKVILISEADNVTRDEDFLNDIESCLTRKQNIIINANARESAQIVLSKLQDLIDCGKIRYVTRIYIDSEEIIKNNEIYEENARYIKRDARKFIPRDVRMISDDEHRMCIIKNTTNKIIITDNNGMAKYISEIEKGKKNKWAVIFMNKSSCNRFYKDENTKNASKAYIRYNDESSGYKTRNELLELYRKFNNLKAVLIRHGNPHTKEKLKSKVIEELKIKSYIVTDNSCQVIYPDGRIKNTKTFLDNGSY